MRGARLSHGLRAMLAIFAVSVFAMSTWAVAQESVLHSFGNGNDGQNPGAMIFDAAGNLYGTTYWGGIHQLGTVFEMSPRQGGGWTETVLHSFGNGTDGQIPASGLVLDAAGNLYGTTEQGGVNDVGTVFELSPSQGGGWTETILHNFGNGTDGQVPFAGLIFDTAGNLYGTTFSGGANNYGTVFELSPAVGGGWTESVLYSFTNNSIDGAYPLASLVIDSLGNLYGTTYEGGTATYFGTVFELAPNGDGTWTESVLRSFGNGMDGANPEAGLILDSSGNLYGTTEGGGIHMAGTAFELSPQNGGSWKELVLRSFGGGTDGAYPQVGLTFDPTGNLYGATSEGGIHNAGIAFELSPRNGGGWTERVLRNFGGGTDGANPYSNVILDATGNLYGTTYDGGIHGFGAVYRIVP
jgi:uncharacterized repeat protein (TIGR03803 family)